MTTYHFTTSGPGWTKQEFHFGPEGADFGPGDHAQGFASEAERQQYEEYRRSRAVQHIFQGYKDVPQGRWLESNLADIQKDFPDVKPPKFNAQKKYYYILYDQQTREYIYPSEPGYLCLFDHTSHSWLYIRSDKQISREEDLNESLDEAQADARRIAKEHEGETIISFIPDK